MEKTHGCVYHGESAYQDGAVGVILHGRFALDTLVTPGFRPTGPVMVRLLYRQVCWQPLEYCVYPALAGVLCLACITVAVVRETMMGANVEF
jgi:hypothetical protein